MKHPFEIKDSMYPKWRGMRFSTLEGARREHARSVPVQRFRIIDRRTGKDVT